MQLERMEQLVLQVLLEQPDLLVQPEFMEQQEIKEQLVLESDCLEQCLI
jgi:hypothetical protein